MLGLNALKKRLNRFADNLKDDLTIIIEVEGQNFIKSNFQNEGFDEGKKKWKDRATTDKRGRDITRYRTNRVGRQGSLNKYGRSNQGRAILTGHNTGGDKLRNSFSSHRQGTSVIFRTYKPYARRHNEGLDGMPKRQFMGKSPVLNKRIRNQFKKYVKSRLKL